MSFPKSSVALLVLCRKVAEALFGRACERRDFRGALACAALLALGAHADGPAGYRPREQQSLGPTDQAAIDAYNEGYALIQRAEHGENLALASGNDQERAAARKAAAEAYDASLGRFAVAVQMDRSMHEALTYMGYANRKLGRHQASLDSYARALKINPDYPPAIEYQGQAYLGLNRVDAARFNYLRLYALNPRLASKLFRAIQQWQADHRDSPPADVDMQALAEWIEERARSVESSAASNTSNW